MKEILIIEGDTNDADYITSEHIVTNDNKVKELVAKVADALKAVKKKTKEYGYKWNASEYSHDSSPEEMYKDYLTEDDIEGFNDLIPYGENGIHSINSIRILTVAKEEALIKR